jgi:methionyl-tRNA formyltransferase
MDTGPVLATHREVAIGPETTAGELGVRCSPSSRSRAW